MINNAPGISLYREFIMLASQGNILTTYPTLDCRSSSRGLLPLTNGNPCPVSRLSAQKAVSSTQGLPCAPCLEEHHQISVVPEFLLLWKFSPGCILGKQVGNPIREIGFWRKWGCLRFLH